MTDSVALDHRLVRDLYDPDSDPAFTAAVHPLLPLDAPGMPLPGPDFLMHAMHLGDNIDLELARKKKLTITTPKLVSLYRAALYSPKFAMPVVTKGKIDPPPLSVLPGHIWGSGKHVDAYGPRHRARVMVVGKIPGRYEKAQKNATAGPSTSILMDAFDAAGIEQDEFRSWYVTFACKFTPPDDEVTAVQASWLKDCAILLEQEIRLVEPEFILCLGNEATKCVLNATGSVSNLNSRILVHKAYGADGNEREIKVMPIMHPAYVARKPEASDDFYAQVARFKAMLDNRLADNEEVDHADVYTVDALREIVDEMIADPTPNANIIAIDCEWNGDYPTEAGAYLRTVQISNKDRWARTIVLRHQGGEEAFLPNLDAARQELLRLLKSTPERPVRVGGHFFRADLPWLLHFGVDVRPEYEPAEDPEDRTHGGWDTSLMYHAVNECARFGLDECTLRFTRAPTYWEELDNWKKAYKSKHKVKVDGYGCCPEHILHPYASYDVDVTRRIMMRFYGTNGTDGLLASDVNGQDCWYPYWIAHSASLAFLEMEMTGMVLDRDRADELTTLFINTQDRMLAEIREELNWPAFNPKSQPQLAVALFGHTFGERYTNPPSAPDDAKLLNLVPVKTTGKRPILWRELQSRGNMATATPSTDKESLGILGHANPTAAKIRDYKFMSQVLQSTLRRPNMSEDGDFEVDENDNYVYEKGLVGCVHADGKVRTHLFQTKETGRASSSRPPLQNLSSRREDDYRRILGAQYQHPVRSILRVPKGCVGIETDLTGAELAVLAWLAQDVNMIEHVRRNILPEDHPDHYDIHSRQAVKAFNIQGVEPTKKGLIAVGKKGLRVAAKNVNFGIPYGRGPEAIARQCKEEGVDVTPQECQEMIDAYFDSYPKTKTFLAECRRRSQDEGFIVGPYGRMRRFVPAPPSERSVRGEQERQAQNFPIQGGVADAVSIALNNFYQYRAAHPEIQYDIALQIHDAIVLIVPIEHAEVVYKEVVPLCMVDGVPFYPRHLNGEFIAGAGPYYFGADRDVFVHWGEKIKPEKARAIGLPWLAEELA
jgi:uracil-DNA glycosylase family 4